MAKFVDWPAAAVLLIAAVWWCSGCGGSATPRSSASTARLTTVERGSSSAASSLAGVSSASGAGGLVLVSCDAWNHTWTVVAYQPGGAVAFSRTFNTTGYTTSLGCDPTSMLISNAPLRLLFNQDFTAMAVARDVGGASHVGVLRAGGAFTDLSHTQSGFASTPNDQTPIFEPTAPNRLTFISPEMSGTGGVVYEIDSNGTGRRRVGE